MEYYAKNNKPKDKENNSQENIKEIKTKNDERKALNGLALKINELCKKIKSEIIDNDKITNEIAEAYSQISSQLQTTMQSIYKNRENKNSVLKKSIEAERILKFEPFKYDYNQLDFLDIVKSIIENEKWIKKFTEIKGGHSSVWNDNISNAIEKLVGFDLTGKFGKLVKN